MKYLITSFFLLLGAMTRAQDFYDMNTIQTIEVTFSQSNWDQLLDNAYASTGDYIMAQSVTINGVPFIRFVMPGVEPPIGPPPLVMSVVRLAMKLL